tara:strand:+ start:2690 stop:3328 length:639 start_codon:yes stop_codon:yes gene_type:complete
MLGVGFKLGLSTIVATKILEIINMKTARKIIQTHGFWHYANAWIKSILNSVLFGPLVYNLVKHVYVDKESHSLPVSFIKTPLLIILHSFGYWAAHSLMHEKTLWSAHKFHHTFSTHVTPVVAMAVSPWEYIIAYMAPFVLASWMVTPSEVELVIAAAVVSCCNLIIHTPSLEYTSKYYPKWLVSPSTHLRHHRFNDKEHIAAPTINLDYLFR